MYKKIGNFFIVFLFFLNLNVLSQINKVNLLAKDLNGNELNVAGVGQPFLINLVFESDNSQMGQPILTNIEKYKIGISTNSSFSSINGKFTFTKIFNYEVRIDTIGTYEFGPVIVDGKKFDNTLKIEVQSEQKSKSEIKEHEAFAKILVPETPIYVNQEFKLIVKVYFNDNIHNFDLKFPDIKDVRIGKELGRKKFVEKIQKQDYLVHELRYALSSKKPGPVIIPALKVSYNSLVLNNNFFNFFGFQQIEKKEIVSNAFNLNILPLPTFEKKVNGVGKFQNFRASVNNSKALKSEPIVLKLEIEGKSNLENVSMTELNLPEDLTYYSSKSYICENNQFKKIFEFIIQSEKIGEFEIPKQHFVFFNPDNQKFELLYSKPILIKIQEEAKKLIIDDKEKLLIEDVKSISQSNNNTFQPINIKTFIILVFLPFILFFLSFIKNLFFASNWYSNYLIFNKSFAALNDAKKNNDIEKIYSVFFDFFCKKLKINRSSLDSTLINENLQKNFHNNIILQWKLFFERVEKYSYFKKEIVKDDLIFNESFNWLKKFKKL